MAVPVTGLSQIGDQLLRASGDYANIKLRKQQEDEQRARALADLADQRQYSEFRGDVERGNRMTDATQLANMNQRFDALQRAQRLGLIAATDLGKIEVENLALMELAKREAAEVAQKDAAKIRAQERVDRNATTAKSITDQIAEDERIANSSPQIDPVELRREQERMARLANPDKKQISQSDIDGQYNAAITALNEKLGMEWMQRMQEAKINIQNNKILLRSLMDENNQLAQMFGVVGDVPATPMQTPAAMLAPPQSNGDPMAAFKGMSAPPPASMAPPAQAPTDFSFPATSVRGLAERAPAVIAAPGTLLDKAVMGGSGVARGLWDGNYTNSIQRGPTQAIGESIGSFLSGPVQGPVDPVQVARTQWLQNAWRDASNPPKPLGPLKNLDPTGPYRTLLQQQTPTSAFSYPDPYGSLMGP